MDAYAAFRVCDVRDGTGWRCSGAVRATDEIEKRRSGSRETCENTLNTENERGDVKLTRNRVRGIGVADNSGAIVMVMRASEARGGGAIADASRNGL
jgi:hypothetical protein